MTEWIGQYMSMHTFFVLMSMTIEATIIICALWVIIRQRNTLHRHEKTAETVYDVQLSMRRDLARIANILAQRQRNEQSTGH